MSNRSPLHDLARKAGAVFADQAGWDMPWHYDDALAEYRVACANAVLIDVSHRTRIVLTGRDRAEFLHNFCTNEVKRLPGGSGCEAFLTNARGKILAQAWIFARPESLWLEADPGLGPKILQHLDHYLIAEDVVLTDRTAEVAQLMLTGPEAEAILSRAAGTDLTGTVNLQHWPVSLGGIECHLQRRDTLGPHDIDIFCPADAAGQVWQALLLQGARPAGLSTYEILRLEAGTPEYGRDIDESNYPQEVGRDSRAISFTKGCYLGQEPVVMIRDRGQVQRFLVGLKWAGDHPAPAGARVLHAGQEVGKITSSVHSPRLGSAIALAYVRRGQQAPETAVEVEWQGSTIAAQVKKLPLVPA
jgi:folate-binding protein YgfZ